MYIHSPHSPYFSLAIPLIWFSAILFYDKATMLYFNYSSALNFSSASLAWVADPDNSHENLLCQHVAAHVKKQRKQKPSNITK